MADHHYVAVNRGNIGLEDNQFSYGTTTLPDYTSVAADIAVLVADGASPTQGHVNTLNSDWATFKTALDLLTTALAVGDAVLYIKDSASLTRLELTLAMECLEGFFQSPRNITGTKFPPN